MDEFAGKVAIVTGAGSGIGEACATLLARRGAKVLVADVRAEPAVAVAAAIGDAARPHVVDVTDPAACEAMVDAAVDAFGRLDVAVNNAGIGGPQAPTGEYPLDGWAAVIAVNLSGVFYCMRAEISAMLATGGGSIVNMASILGSVGFAQSVAYVSAKHGVGGVAGTARALTSAVRSGTRPPLATASWCRSRVRTAGSATSPPSVSTACTTLRRSTRRPSRVSHGTRRPPTSRRTRSPSASTMVRVRSVQATMPTGTR